MGDDQQASDGGPVIPSTEQQDGQTKGPFSGLIPDGAMITPATPPAAGGFLGNPSGIPGFPGGLSGAAGDGQNPTLVLGGFSVLVMPLRGMSLANMASIMTSGQQMMQLMPKPGSG